MAWINDNSKLQQQICALDHTPAVPLIDFALYKHHPNISISYDALCKSFVFKYESLILPKETLTKQYEFVKTHYSTARKVPLNSDATF